MTAGRATPAVSVVVPAFDAAETLDEQLTALREQVVPDGVGVEVLVCDNGSRDATRALVEARAQQWPALRLLDASARRGPAAARNVGAAAARGELVLFCDADDVVAPGWVAAMVTALGEHPLVAGRLEYGRLNGTSRLLPRIGVLDSGLYTKPFMPGLPGGGSGNMGVRRETFLALGGFCEDAPVAEDVDLCWRAQLGGRTLAFVGDAVVHVRRRGTVRGLWRQGFAYGRGDAWLIRRFAGAPVPQPGPAAPARVGLRRRVRRFLGAVHRLADFGDRIFGAAFVLGRTFGRPPEPTPWDRHEPGPALTAAMAGAASRDHAGRQTSEPVDRGLRTTAG